jgi:hypothetical protein
MIGRKVFVYRNLRKKCYSVKCMLTKRVIAHVNSIELLDPFFKVSESGRQRVLRDKQKNVHAGVVGIWVEGFWTDGNVVTRKVTYNPYRYCFFVYEDTKMPAHSAVIARLDKNGIETYN